MDYQVKGMTGTRPKVIFRCATCRKSLNAPLTDAGNSDRCPTCGAALHVPGTPELAQWRQIRKDLEACIPSKKNKLSGAEWFGAVMGGLALMAVISNWSKPSYRPVRPSQPTYTNRPPPIDLHPQTRSALTVAAAIR